MRMMHSVAASAIASVHFLAEPVRIGDAIHLPERLPRRRSLVDGSGGGGWEHAAQWYATSTLWEEEYVWYGIEYLVNRGP